MPTGSRYAGWSIIRSVDHLGKKRTTTATMNDKAVPREIFEKHYASGSAPWDIPGPQQPFVDASDRIVGTVLDAGCGTGENALFFAERGHIVTGIDFLEVPIQLARQKAQDRDVTVDFRVHDALQLADLGQAFDNLLDCGLFHTFSDEQRIPYVGGLGEVTRSGGKLFLMCFSDREPGEEGPRRVSQHEIGDAFSQGWEIESIAEQRFAINPDFTEADFSGGGPIAWFCVIRRQ